MDIALKIHQCPYCGEVIPLLSGMHFSCAIYPNYRAHLKVCKKSIQTNFDNMGKENGTTNDIPRRIRVDLFVPAEKAIYDAAQEVEKKAPDVRLTDAVKLLHLAREKVADYVDGVVSEKKHPTLLRDAREVYLEQINRATEVFVNTLIDGVDDLVTDKVKELLK